MPDTVRVGVIGTSWLEDRIHLPGLRSHPQAEVAAICGRNESRARELAEKHSVAAVFTDYRQMIEKGGLDAVVVASPDELHYPMTMAALDHRLHVFCEKPLAMSSAEAREMYNRAEEQGVKHMVNFTWRGLPGARYLKELVDEGYVGRQYHCDISYLAGYARSGPQSWRFDPAHSHGILADLGSHMIDLSRHLVSEVSQVCAHLAAPVPVTRQDGSIGQSANQSAMLLLEFANGAQGTIKVSALAHVGDRRQEQRIRLHGEAGTLEYDVDLSGLVQEIRGSRATEPSIQPMPIPDRLWGDVEDRHDVFEPFSKLPIGVRLFVDAVVGHRPPSPSFLDGWRVQEVIEAALASHERGTWEAIRGQV